MKIKFYVSFISATFELIKLNTSLKELLKEFTRPQQHIMKTFCFDSRKELYEGIYMLLFAVREVFQESQGFSPFELVLDTPW